MTVRTLARGETREPLVRGVVVWPPLLAATLFCFFGFEMVWQSLATRPQPSDLAPLRRVFSRPGTTILRLEVVSDLIASRGIVLVGGALPAWLVSLLYPGP